MLRNNNMAVVTRMAKSSLKGNKRRSITMILAVLLATFMLFSVFTIGITYFKMQRVQNIRLSGAEFDAIMYGATDEQQEICRNSSDVVKTGICAVAGYVEETPKDGTPNVGLMWADNTFWNDMMKPAREWVKGKYPVAENEVMVTRKALKECGYENLDVGDTFQMTFSTPYENKGEIFRISGIWDGYGPKAVFYMSEEFYKKSGYTVDDVASGRYYMNFKQRIMTQKEQDAFVDSMHLSKQQRLFYTGDMGYSFQILLGSFGLVLVTCICSYLLIYNIMYLSVAGNIRYYGLLQTIGMTERQIYGLVQKQMQMIGGIGIFGGLLIGYGVSFFLVPLVVKSLGIRTGEVMISFHPIVFCFSILLVGATIFIASRKPAKIAVMSSPMEALGYRPEAGMKKSRKTGKGKLLWRMAKEQIQKSKKRAVIIMLSLATSMSVFLCMVTMISSQNAREYSYNFMDLDMIIKNDTTMKKESEDRVQIINQELLDEMKEVHGVKEVHPLIYAEITVPWEPGFSDRWMREFYEMWMSVPYEEDVNEYKEHPENFASCLVGIDETELEWLNQTLETPVDTQKFLSGETCILVRDGLEFTNDDLSGQKVTCAEYNDAGNQRTFEIAGLTDENYYTALLGQPPTIIVSDRVVKKFVETPIVEKAGITYEKAYDEKAERELLGLLEASLHAKDFSYDSKIESMKEVRKAQGNMIGVGIGIIAILAVIGLMNYMNTSVSNIRSRQVELSIMESIGMTGNQMRKMLILEGMLYAGGAWGITLTVGLCITYYLYQSMNYRGVSFEIPIVPIILAIVVTLIICITIPLLVYQNLERKATVVERIKGIE